MLKNWSKKIKLIVGLNNLPNPLDSKIEDSRNIIDIIGAISLLPGSINQKEPKVPKMVGIKKNFKNLLEIIFVKE